MIVMFFFMVWFGNVEKNNRLFEEGYDGEGYSEQVEMSSSVEVVKNVGK